VSIIINRKKWLLVGALFLLPQLVAGCSVSDSVSAPENVVDDTTLPGDTDDAFAPSRESAETTGGGGKTIINTVDWVSQNGEAQPRLIPAREPAGLREDGSGAFRTHCIESHESFDDPIVYPNKPGNSHHHIFFGNPDIDANTDVDQLPEVAKTTCDGVNLNRSAYWVPALYGADGERIRYVDPLFYYKTGYHVPADEIEPMPEGLRMIAGNMGSTVPQTLQVTKFRCESWIAPEPQFSSGDPLDHVSYIPDCDVGDIVEMRLVFPQCWDGKNISAPDHQSHMAYPIEATAPNVGTGYCPTSHPVAIPEISYNFGVRVTEETGPPAEWRFASDPLTPGSGGASFHGDWINGWDSETMEKIVANCLNEARECMTGLLGDGTELQPVPLDE
jgi:hypothetical protein